MRRACFALVLLAGLSGPGTASAADNTVVGVGTGAVAGALVAGPFGAVVGAVAGGVIGSNSSARPRYARRSRSAYRRRSSARPVAERARLAERAPLAATPSRVAPAASEAGPQPRPETTGSTAAPVSQGWQDPN